MEKDETPRKMSEDGAPQKMSDEEKRRKRERLWVARMRQIVPGLFIGNVEGSHNTELLVKNRINAMVSLTDARLALWRTPGRRACVPEHRHKWVQCVDSSTQDLLIYMSDICDFIDEMVPETLSRSSCLPTEPVDESQSPPESSVLVHCEMGISRSSTVIIAYLMRKYKIKPDKALQFVLTRQRVKPSDNFKRQLQVWDEVDHQVWGDKPLGVAKAPYQAYLDDRDALLREKGITGNEPLAPLNL